MVKHLITLCLFLCACAYASNCPLSWSNCGNLCYNPSVQYCVQNQVHYKITKRNQHQNTQCTSPFLPCSNNLCYNPQIQNCINGAIVSIGQPGTTNTNTGSTPPAAPDNSGDLNQFRCNTTSCPSGMGCCDDILVGPLCFFASDHTCTPLGNGSFRYCCCPTCFPCGDDLRCYNSQSHTCVDGVVTPNDRVNTTTPPATPQQPPAAPQPPAAGTCSTTNCQSGALCCDDIFAGPLCFFASDHTCTPLGNGSFRYCCCATCFPCGDDLRCYNNQSHTCVNGVVTPNDRVNNTSNTPPAAPDTPNAPQCSAPFQPCSNLCYNPQIQNCINGAIVSIGQPGTTNTNTGDTGNNGDNGDTGSDS